MGHRAAVAAVLAVAACHSAPGINDPKGDVDAGPPNPIQLENQQSGTATWKIDGNHQAVDGQIEGYADATSVNHGESVGIHVRTDSARTFRWELFRIGYYGGAGGRLMASGGPLQAGPQSNPAPDPRTGLTECHWPTTFTLQTEASWPSGVLLVKLTRDDGLQQYIHLVVRADERKGVAVVQAAVATYQAYNEWMGESLYTDVLGLSGGRAKEVSFDRPYRQGLGSGDFLTYELYFVEWIESMGFDVTYATNIDIATRDILSRQKLFISVGHDEYWPRGERQAVEAALAAGVNLAFFSGNSAYWQIRFEPERHGSAANRTEVCYKENAPAEDPLARSNLITMRWREPGPGAPEEQLLGIMYQSWQAVDVPFIVSDASHWAYAGTGLVNGDALPFIVGNESDRYFGDATTPPNVQVIASGPTIDHYGRPSWHNAASYVAPSGAFVFAAGTIEWSWGLSRPGTTDARVQKITRNVFEHAGLQARLPGDSFGAAARALTDRAGGASSVTTLAGAGWKDGLVDGPASSSRFRRPAGVAVDPAGRIFVADSGNHAIRMIGTDGARTVQTIVSSGLSFPTGIAVGGDGTLYVADTGNHRVVRILGSSPWTVSALASGFYSPMGVAVAGSDVYVTDSGNNRLVRISSSGSVSTVVGDGSPSSADGPGSRARLNYPTGVAYGNGALWVVETQNHALRRVALDGAYTTATVTGGNWAGGYSDGDSRTAAFLPMFGVAISNGSVLIADTGNNRIRRVSAAGATSTFAGTGGGGATDGPGASATVTLPFGIAVLPNGDVVVADEGASTIRVLHP